MDATQMISDSILESDDEENEQENENKKRSPLAKLCILKNEHISEIELPLFLGDNVLGRDPNTCALTLPAPSISKQHATISISVYRRTGCHSEVDIEALVWDLGSMNGTHKGRIKLTPNVRYALSDGDSLVLADIPCHYVNCAVNTVSSQEDMRTSVSRNLVLGEKRGDTSTGSKKCVNGGTKATMSLAKTPVGTSCLSFEQTPTQPQGTLVPESDLDSDDEGRGGRKALVSDSDSHKSSPTCSTFLSPTNKIVPESEDESPITPLSSTKNRPYRDVNLNKDETDVDVGRQQLTKKQGLVIVDEKEQRREEERVITGGAESDKNGHHAEAKQERNVSLIGEDELPVPTVEVSTHTVPAFNLESDTDTEGEQDGVASAHSVSLNQISQPPNIDQFYMDSDTDIDEDEDEDALDKAPKTVPCFNDDSKPPHVVAVIQPDGVTVDSDTDVEDNVAVSDAATKANPLSFHSTHIADSASSTQPKDVYVESDTDVDDEDKAGECGKHKASSKIDACHTRLDVKSVGPKFTSPDAGADLNIPPNSDTDVEDPDSDTDVEDDCPLVIPVTVTALSVSPTMVSDALQSDSDADTDVDESSVPPAEDVDNPADLRVDSGTDVENKETDAQEPGEGQIPNLLREKTPGSLLPVLQNCSTPVQFSGEVENMETQSFLSPSSAPFRYCQEDDDLAETQSFILHAKDCQGNPPDDHTMNPIQAFDLEHSDDGKDEQSSNGASFQLGLSDSSHLQCQAQALAMECTQAFVPVDRNVKLEDTQAYGALLTADRTSTENAPNLGATQSYGEDKEPARYSLVPEKEGQVDLALEATQAYISEPYSNSEDETNKDETKNTNAETEHLDFPTSSTLTMAETQPMSGFEEEETLATDRPALSVQQVKSRTQNEVEERGEHGVVLQTHQRPFSEVLPIAETQPIDTVKDGQSDDERDDEDLFLGPQKRKEKPLQLEEEQTQPLIISETQPMHSVVAEAWKWESDVDITVPGLQNREDKTQRLINPELSIVETQPMNTAEDEESDEDSISGFQKRSAKPQQLEEEIQPHSSSEVAAVKSRPMGACEDEKSSDEDSIQGPCKRKPKPLPLEEEQTQPLSCSEVSAVETQPIVMSEDVESSDEDSIPGPRKRSAKARQLEKERTQLLTNSDVSTVEIQPLETKTDVQPEIVRERRSEAGSRGVIVGNKRGTPEQLKEEHQGKCSDIPKTQTRGKNKEAKEKQRTEQQENNEEENKPRVPVRGRRGARTITTQPEQDSALSTNDDVPARRTRSRSNSVSSEKSASSINTQESRGRGRGRGVKRPSEPPQAAITRSSNRRRTVAAETSQQDSSPQGLRSRSHSSNSLNSEVSSCIVGSQVRGRGGRQRGRERTTEPDSIPPVSSQSNQNSAPKPAARGRKSRKAEGSSSDVFKEEGKQKADSQLATRGRRQASESASEPAAADEEDQSNQEGCHASQDSPLSKRNVRVRGQAVVKGGTVATPGPPVFSEGGQAKDKKIGRKRVLEENTEEDSGSSSKIAKGNEKVQTETRKEKEKHETKDVNPVQTKRRGRASSTRGKKNAGKSTPKVKVKEESEKMEVETVEKRERGRLSAVQNKKKEVQENNGGTSVCSMSQDAKVSASQPQTPISSISRKRRTPADSSPVAKVTRSSSASPAASGRLRAMSQSYKVLFTGIGDEGDERVLAGLGGSMAKDVADMNCLVTDKVRRTVKFLCAVAKGIPIVTTHWLQKSGKAGSFLPPNAFIVKDPEQEKKFSFSLQESLSTASSQPLLQGYEIHVTKSVKPEPVQMKDIISCSGATFLPKMPSSHKPQTVVISCEEDWLLCAPAVSASLPVVTSEFILTGILQQKLDFQTHTLSAPANNLQPAGGRGRIRKKT